MIIQAKELRVGNILQDEIGLETNLVVYKIEPRIITCGDEEFSHPYLIETLKPILLTSEILERFGFKKEERGNKDDFNEIELVYHKDGIDIFDHNEYGQGFAYATYTRYPGRGFKGGWQITTVHQLQNLFHALTSRELKTTL